VEVSASQARDLRFNRHRVLLELYHDTGTAKLPSVIEYLKDLLESGEKFIVFAHHQDVLDGLCHSLYQQNVDHVRIDGHTPAAIRHDLVTHFQTHDTCKVAVISITAAGVGLTLTSASTVIFAELFWNPGKQKHTNTHIERERIQFNPIQSNQYYRNSTVIIDRYHDVTLSLHAFVSSHKTVFIRLTIEHY
jgi:SWI/SNF-related matrix-associated actin-dependent regulator 1 of chromatin subfamily A